jgi:hypothetical protein
MDQQLTYKHHLESVCSKTFSKITLLHCLSQYHGKYQQSLSEPVAMALSTVLQGMLPQSLALEFYVI